MDQVGGAENFTVGPGQCFRMVVSAEPDGKSEPAPCPNHVEIAGRFQDATGHWHDVAACIDHAEDLDDWRRISASITDIGSVRRGPFRGPRPTAS